MDGFSRRQLAMMTTDKIKERYVTDVRLERDVKDLKKALEDRGINVPDGTNPRSLIGIIDGKK